MLEYVKVLLCMYPKMEAEIQEIGKRMEYRALRSYDHTISCEKIAEELLVMRDRAEAYREVRDKMESILKRMDKKCREALGFRFFKEPMPKNVTLRTVYRRSVRGVDRVAEGLEAAGFDKEWFFRYCGRDAEMMFRYRYYRSQTPRRARSAEPKVILRTNHCPERAVSLPGAERAEG